MKRTGIPEIWRRGGTRGTGKADDRQEIVKRRLKTRKKIRGGGKDSKEGRQGMLVRDYLKREESVGQDVGNEQKEHEQKSATGQYQDMERPRLGEVERGKSLLIFWPSRDTFTDCFDFRSLNSTNDVDSSTHPFKLTSVFLFLARRLASMWSCQKCGGPVSVWLKRVICGYDISQNQLPSTLNRRQIVSITIVCASTPDPCSFGVCVPVLRRPQYFVSLPFLPALSQRVSSAGSWFLTSDSRWQLNP